MLKRFPLVLVMFFSLCVSLLAQDDAVLFTVADKPVTVGEFNYIYSKTNGKKADFSKASVEEYLDLYTKFKLKVQKAREMQIDTIPTLKRELEGYQMQLANSYLIDKEVKERLLKEAYERQKKDVNISHIMVRIPGSQLPADTLKAYKKIQTAKEVISKGSSFTNAAEMYSEDTYSKNNGGNIGWITAVLPNGFYEMENAAYNTKKGEVSDIVRTNMGYHLIQVNETRPARGTLEVAQIVIWGDKKDPSKSPKTTIDNVYQQLKEGADFEKLAREFSSDKKTAKKGGYLGFFGIGEYEAAFEDTAFSLEKDGDFSEPIQTSIGWHIIKRVSRPEYGSYDMEKNRLQSKIEKDSRFTEARDAMAKRIKREGKFTINQKTFSDFRKTLDEDFLTSKWRAPRKSGETLFSFEEGKDMTYDLGGFTDYLVRNTRKRILLGRDKMDIDTALDNLLEEYSDTKAMDYEKSQLSRKYPDFRALTREYEEGILLFEVTKMQVWDKASKDTAGLEKFYEANKGNYLWGNRANVSLYTLKSNSEKIIAKTRKLAKRKPSAKVLSKINRKGNLLSITTVQAEKGKNKYPELEKMDWKKGTMTSPQTNNDNTTSFMKIESLLPKEQKTLAEARGYVIADYQDQLEAEWIEELKKQYPVKINQKVLNSIIK